VIDQGLPREYGREIFQNNQDALLMQITSIVRFHRSAGDGKNDGVAKTHQLLRGCHCFTAST